MNRTQFVSVLMDVLDEKTQISWNMMKDSEGCTVILSLDFQTPGYVFASDFLQIHL